METENKSLSEKIKGKDYCPSSDDKWIFVLDVKEKIQNAQKRLKPLVISDRELNKIFKEEFGDELIKNGKSLI